MYIRTGTHALTYRSILLGWLLLLSASFANAEFVVSHRLPASATDKRDAYTIALIKLALEKTVPKYGSYSMHGIPAGFYNLRARTATSANLFPNMLLEESYDDEFITEGKLTYINFPIDLGIHGYRVCFVNPQVKDEINAITSVEQLKKFTIGQGIGWQDAKILRYNGFKVVEVDAYESLFKMVAAGRIDLFCTGANQIMNEYLTHQDLAQLTIETSFALAYPLPRFFFMHPDNQLLKTRIEEGLKIAYKDGSLKKLWDTHYLVSVDFIHLDKRKLFQLKSPLIDKLDKGYQQYNYAPLKK